MTIKRIGPLAVLFGGLVTLAATTPSQAVTIAAWDFGADTPGDAADLEASVTTGQVTASTAASNGTPTTFASATDGGAPQAPGTGISGNVLLMNGPHSSGGISTSGKSAGDLAGNNNYWKVSVTADSGYDMDISSFEFDYSLVSTNRGWALGYIADGGSLVVIDNGSTRYNTGDNTYYHVSYTLPLTDVQTIEFRWYTFGNNTNNKDLRWDNVTVNGAVSAVPEPGAFMLVGLGLCLVAIRR